VRRVDAIFGADRSLAKLAPAQRKTRRDEIVLPLVDSFFAWAGVEYDKLTERGLVATALGYSVRHELALRRFLDDGRLRMDNNAAERAIRTVAVGRRAWMFYGSDDHASAAGNILSLVASCKLHELDPELYLTEIIRIVPYWPRDRYLELSPKYWRATRADVRQGAPAAPRAHHGVPAALGRAGPAGLNESCPRRQHAPEIAAAPERLFVQRLPVLFLIIGLGPLVAAAPAWRRHRWAALAIAVGAALLTWMVVEIAIVGYTNAPPLQAIYFRLARPSCSWAFAGTAVDRASRRRRCAPERQRHREQEILVAPDGEDGWGGVD
jgi:hypothetical protein